MSKLLAILKKLFKNVSKFSNRIIEVVFDFLAWFLEDAAFALLPIAVIVSVKYLSTGNFDILYLSPEWSFPTIVLVGTGITTLIKLKTEIQRDFSTKLYTGTRLLIFYLIASVLVLALVIFRESKFPTNSLSLWIAQIFLLFISLYSLYMVHVEKLRSNKIETEFPSDMGRVYYFNVLQEKLGRVRYEIRGIRFALSKHQDIQYKGIVSARDVHFWDRARKADLAVRYRTIKKEFIETEAAINKFVMSPLPESAIENTPKPASKNKLGKKH